jgi:hypothetical protein
MQAALRGYALQLVAYAATSPAALEAVRAGLRPLDAFRAANERRASRGGVAEPEPSEPGGEGDAGEPGDANEGGEPGGGSEPVEGGEGESGV